MRRDWEACPLSQMSVEFDVWSRLDENTDGADGADDRVDEDGDDCTDVAEGVSLGARANGFPPPPSVSGSRLSRPR